MVVTSRAGLTMDWAAAGFLLSCSTFIFTHSGRAKGSVSLALTVQPRPAPPRQLALPALFQWLDPCAASVERVVFFPARGRERIPVNA